MKNKERKLSMCDGKDQLTRETAQKVAAAMRRRSKKSKLPATPYECPECKMWHVGGKVK